MSNNDFCDSHTVSHTSRNGRYERHDLSLIRYTGQNDRYESHMSLIVAEMAGKRDMRAILRSLMLAKWRACMRGTTVLDRLLKV